MKKLVLLLFVLTISSLLPISSNAQLKKVLLEQHTGSWCGWCVDGSYIMDQLLEEYPDQVIGVKIHNGDSMVIPEQVIIGTALSCPGYPSGTIDRKNIGGAVFAYRDKWKSNCESQMQTKAKADVQVSYAIDPESRMLSASVNCIMSETVNSTLKFNLYIVEDSVSGTGTGWDQSNYLYNRAGYENNPYYKLPAKIIGYQHMKVVRAMLGGAWGTGLIPKPAQAGQIYTQDFSYTIPVNWKLKDLHVVGLVQTDETNNKEILNCAMGIEGKLDMQLSSAGESFDVKPQGIPFEKVYTLKNLSDSEKTFVINASISKTTPVDWTGGLKYNNETLSYKGTENKKVEVVLASGAELLITLSITPGSNLGKGGSEMIVSIKDNPTGFKGQGSLSCFSQEIKNFEIINAGEMQYSLNNDLKKAGFNNFYNVSMDDFDKFSSKFTPELLIWNTGGGDVLTANNANTIKAAVEGGYKVFVCGSRAVAGLNSYGGMESFGTGLVGYSREGYYQPWDITISGVENDPITGLLGKQIDGRLLAYLASIQKIIDNQNTQSILHFTNDVYYYRGTNDSVLVPANDAIIGVRSTGNESRSVLLSISPFIIKNQTIRSNLVNNIMQWLVNEGPEIAFNVSSFNFGSVELSQSFEIPFKINNNGNEELIIDDIYINGTDSYVFKLKDSPEFPINISSTNSENLTISFRPTSEKNYLCTLNVVSNARNGADLGILVTGTGHFTDVNDPILDNIETSLIPNPAVDESLFKLTTANYSGNNIKLSINSLLGNQIFAIKTDSEMLAKGIMLDFSSYPSGTYYINTNINGKVYIEPIVVLK